MKKFLLMALVLVMVLGICAPALAYTTNVATTGSNLYTVDIYLVEYTGYALSPVLSESPVNRGYARNEVVSAIGSIVVPGSADVWSDGYEEIYFSGKNVTLNVTDNNPKGNVNAQRFGLQHTMPNESGWQANYWYLSDDTKLTHAVGAPAGKTVGGVAVENSFPVVNSSRTYRFLVFGKILADNANLSFALSKSTVFASPSNGRAQLALGTISNAIYRASGWLRIGDEYLVFKSAGTNEYLIYGNPPTGYAGENFTAYEDNLLFRIGVTASGKTERLYMYPTGANGTEYRVLVEPSTKELVFLYNGGKLPSGVTVGDQVKYSSSSYNGVFSFYQAEFESGLGLSAYYEGNLLRESDWSKIAGAGDIIDTVSIEPWTPYVTIPETIIVNPPKTGAAASVLGFVFIAIAGALVVVTRKARLFGK